MQMPLCKGDDGGYTTMQEVHLCMRCGKPFEPVVKLVVKKRGRPKTGLKIVADVCDNCRQKWN